MKHIPKLAQTNFKPIIEAINMCRWKISIISKNTQLKTGRIFPQTPCRAFHLFIDKANYAKWANPNSKGQKIRWPELPINERWPLQNANVHALSL
ncbi:MAG: hypothetical protein OXC72_15325 [Roseovarius sp.]|nr:hypothetical protein [Roseovarius sp.]